jgi:Fe2+ or Zn2+ uptake regulation protein
MRRTQQRRLVWEALHRVGPHCTAEEIAADLVRTGQRIPRSTVYRALDALAQAGVVRSLRLGAGPMHFEVSDQDHQHAICQVCESVMHLEGGLADDIEVHLRQQHHFQPLSIDVLVVGVCATCAGARPRLRPAGRTIEHVHPGEGEAGP